MDEYEGSASTADVTAVLSAVRFSPILRGIIETVSRNAAEGGIRVRPVVGGRRVEITDETVAHGSRDRWTSLVGDIVTDIMTVGYSVLVVDPDAKHPDDRAYVVRSDRYTLKWRYKNHRRVYAAIPTAAPDGARGMKTVSLADKPIKHSFVHVMYHPAEDGRLTSPVAQTTGIVETINRLIATEVDGAQARAFPPVVVQHVPESSSGGGGGGGGGGNAASGGPNVPYNMATLTADGVVSHAITTLPAASAINQDYAVGAASIFAAEDENAQKDPDTEELLDDAGRRTIRLAPGTTLVRDSAVPTVDAAGTVQLLTWLIILIGRTMGVSAEYLMGGEGGGGSRLVAGVEASRRQLAVMVSSIQIPLGPFLQRAFARYYRDVLREMLGTDAKGGDDVEEPAAKRQKKGGGTEPTMHEDRVEVDFNNVPYLDLDTVMRLLDEGMITFEAAQDHIARMYRLPETALTPEDPLAGVRFMRAVGVGGAAAAATTVAPGGAEKIPPPRPRAPGRKTTAGKADATPDPGT